MQTIALPLKFKSGDVVVYADTEDEYYKQILFITLQTHPKEMPLNPSFGTNDPTFALISRANMVEMAARYVPELKITHVSAVVNDNGEEQLKIDFVR